MFSSAKSDNPSTTPVAQEERPGFSSADPLPQDEVPQDRDQKIVLFRDMCDLCADDLESIEQTRAVQNDWEAVDPISARAYFLDRLKRHPDSALHHYLYGRLVKSQKEAVEHARRAIELAQTGCTGTVC